MEQFKLTLQDLKALNEKYKCFITINNNFEKEAKDAEERATDQSDALKGLFFSVKDNICARGLRTTAGSRILENFWQFFNKLRIWRAKKPPRYFQSDWRIFWRRSVRYCFAS
ncbi:MAG: hypothetical protein CVU81_01360 [Euryarchaeota archaeon HGW-Euryarchaeota-1]|nr:MAG: hypothetical protein CVU81_01360 [Euryarchaeota archaeon HGW-Euryarchaeota-1]